MGAAVAIDDVAGAVLGVGLRHLLLPYRHVRLAGAVAVGTAFADGLMCIDATHDPYDFPPAATLSAYLHDIAVPPLLEGEVFEPRAGS